jgi:hypothetical protein
MWRKKTMSAEDKAAQALKKAQDKFEDYSFKLAVQFGYSAADIRQAYEADKPGLRRVFNAMTEAKEARNENIGWTVAALIFIPVLAPLPAYFAWKRHQELEGVRQQVGYEIEHFKALPAPPAVPQLPSPPPPPAPLI